jgi:hypothetical protein
MLGIIGKLRENGLHHARTAQTRKSARHAGATRHGGRGETQRGLIPRFSILSEPTNQLCHCCTARLEGYSMVKRTLGLLIVVIAVIGQIVAALSTFAQDTVSQIGDPLKYKPSGPY